MSQSRSYVECRDSVCTFNPYSECLHCLFACGCQLAFVQRARARSVAAMAFPTPKRLRALASSLPAESPSRASSDGDLNQSTTTEELMNIDGVFQASVCDCIAICHAKDIDASAIEHWSDDDIMKLEALPGRYWRITTNYNCKAAWKREEMHSNEGSITPLYIVWSSQDKGGWVVTSDPMQINDTTMYAWSSSAASQEAPWPQWLHVPFWAKKKSDLAINMHAETCFELQCFKTHRRCNAQCSSGPGRQHDNSRWSGFMHCYAMLCLLLSHVYALLLICLIFMSTEHTASH